MRDSINRGSEYIHIPITHCIVSRIIVLGIEIDKNLYLKTYNVSIDGNWYILTYFV